MRGVGRADRATTPRSARGTRIPQALHAGYVAAWQTLLKIGIRQLEEAEEPTLVDSIVCAIAFGKKQPALGRFAIAFTEDEREELLERITG
jgi:hypothetical protein